MNRVGIYYAFWEREWAADFRPYVKKVKALGFDTLEIAAGALPDMTAADRRALRDEAEAEVTVFSRSCATHTIARIACKIEYTVYVISKHII